MPLDNAVPGVVTGRYITGSIALDDYQPAIIDIEVVGIVAGGGRWLGSG